MNDQIEILKTPPHSSVAELSVLTGICWRAEAMDDVATILDAGDFYHTKNQIIFTAMFELHSSGSAIELSSLFTKLQGEKRLDEAGGVEYLTKLTNTACTATNVMNYARDVLDRAWKRRLMNVCRNTLSDAQDGDKDALSLISEADTQIVDIGASGAGGGPEPIAGVIRETVQSVEDAYHLQQKGQGSELATQTGLVDLDNIMGGGLWRSEYTILAARPSEGKTSLALNMAENVAMRGHGVLFFSAEMPRQVLVGKMSAARAGLSWFRVRQGKLTADEFDRFTKHGGDMYQLPIRIDDTTRNITRVASHARSAARDKAFGLRLVIVDYLQLYNSGSREQSREREIASMSQTLAGLRSLGVHVLAIAQLNRTHKDKAKNAKPSKDQLRESGTLEQDADNVLLIYRPGKHGMKDPETQQPYSESATELIVDKQRNGPTGIVELNFVADLQRFEGLAGPQYHNHTDEGDDDDNIQDP